MFNVDEWGAGMRSLLQTYIWKVNFLELAARFENPWCHLKFKRKKIDAPIFLDIQIGPN